MLCMEDTYQTNSLLFKKNKDGLINFGTVSYVLGILVLVQAIVDVTISPDVMDIV